MSWIKARLNKDNFWNVMFFFGMSTGMSLSLGLGKILCFVSFFLFWGSLILVPSIIVSHNRTVYANKEFFNSHGKKLTTYPKNLFWPIIATIAAVAFTGLILDSLGKSISDSVAFGILVTIFFAVLTSYFIILNCPISILFNKHTWQSEVNGFDPNNRFIHTTSSGSNSFNDYSPSLSSPNYSNDNAYRHMSCNSRYHR